MDPASSYFLFSVLIGVWANSWNRSGFAWFFLAVILSPIITSVVLLIAGEESNPISRGK